MHLSLGTRRFARGRRKGSGHVPTLELCVVITVSPVTQYRVELSLPTSHVSQPDAITVSSKLGPTAVSKATKVCTEHANAHSLFWPSDHRSTTSPQTLSIACIQMSIQCVHLHRMTFSTFCDRQICQVFIQNRFGPFHLI